MEQIDKLKEEFDKEFGPKTIWVVPSKENIETIKDIWSWIIQNFTPKEEVKKIDMKNKPMTPREEFEKLFEHVAYELDGNKYLALNLNLNPDEIWNWHISEMEKLLERVEKEVTGEIKIIEPPKEVEKFKEKRQAFMAGEMNILMRLHDKFQSLNKLKEEK